MNMYAYTQELKLFIYSWAMFVQQRMNIVPTNSGLHTIYY